MEGLIRPLRQLGRAGILLVLAVGFVGCLPGDGPERVSFEGLSYSGLGLAGLQVPESQVTPIGSALSVDATDIADHTVYGLDGVAVEDAIVLRRNIGEWAVFISRTFDEVPALCSYFEPRPPDCS